MQCGDSGWGWFSGFGEQSWPHTTAVVVHGLQLAKQHDVGFIDANIEVVDVDLAGDRRLMLRHTVVKGAQLNEVDTKRVLQHLADLWTYDVSLAEVDTSDKVLKEYVLHPRGIAAAA